MSPGQQAAGGVRNSFRTTEVSMTNHDSTAVKADNVAVAEAEIDYTPKKMSLKDQLLYGSKMVAVMAVFFAILWFNER
tara:strand:- start:43888 stop:44121 length:234 start_codon:yes stop_codon:yes gene_type:complete